MVLGMRSMRYRRLVMFLGTVWACGPRVLPQVGESGASTDEVTGPDMPTQGSGIEPESTTATGDGSPGDTASGVTFIDTTDVGSTWMCHLESQDCEAGFKCVPYDATGQGRWNATGCFPVHHDPVDLLEPCRFEGALWSGHDDCGWAAVCWPDGGENTGHCKGLCVKDRVASWAPCEDEDAIPYIGCQSCFCVCETACNPLLQDCHDDLMCVVTGTIATCVFDASGDGGDYGDPCAYVNTCNPGLSCVNAAAVPGCEGGQGCCTPYCDTSGTDVCPDSTSCLPMYEGGAAPPGLEDVGICIST
jgi:hypothetical protein